MCKHLLILASVANIVIGTCKSSNQPPNVIVADSDHLLVNWANSFEGCDRKSIQSASVEIDDIKSIVNFENGKAKVRSDPCLKHIVRVELKYFNQQQHVTKDIWSQPSSYNAQSVLLPLSDSKLFSGLLQEQVVNKTCIESDGKVSIPNIPSGIKNCVLETSWTTGSNKRSKGLAPQRKAKKI